MIAVTILIATIGFGVYPFIGYLRASWFIALSVTLLAIVYTLVIIVKDRSTLYGGTNFGLLPIGTLLFVIGLVCLIIEGYLARYHNAARSGSIS